MRTTFILVATVAVLLPLQSLADSNGITSKTYLEPEAKALASQSYAHLLQSGSPYWSPTSEQVRNLEEALPRFLQRAWPAGHPPIKNLEKYLRQYFGITRGGKRTILLNAACESYASTNPKWHERFIFVFDGGSCFFQVEYDPDSLQFRNLNVNGFG